MGSYRWAPYPPFHVSCPPHKSTISKQFMILVLLAFLIAIPLSLYVIQKWLQNFAYHIELNWQVFALALALVSVLAIVTLAYHTIKASIENPVKNLRTD